MTLNEIKKAVKRAGYSHYINKNNELVINYFYKFELNDLINLVSKLSNHIELDILSRKHHRQAIVKA